MHWNSFGRSAVFAAVAAAAWLPWALFIAPLLGVWNAHALYLAAAVVIYAAGLSRRPARALLVAGGAAAGALLVLLVAASSGELVLGLCIVLALVRTALRDDGYRVRALLSEAMIGVAALLITRAFAAPLPLTAALCVWSFFLVQSCRLLGGSAARHEAEAGADAFDLAHRRAMALLENRS